MKHIKTFALFFVIAFGCTHVSLALNDASDTVTVSGLELIVDRIVSDKIGEALLDTTYSDKHIAQLLSSVNENGCWDDIDYTSQESAAWEPHYHLDRTIILAIGYINKESIYYQNKHLEETIGRLLSFWADSNASCTNWWWGVIGEPQRLGLLLNLLSYANIKLGSEVNEALLERLPDKDPFTYSGANRSDVGIAMLYKYLYVKDENRLNNALNAIFSSIEYGVDQSFQKDGCYFESGRQLYIGGYAEVLLKNTLKFAEYVLGTDYSIDSEKVGIMSNYVRGVYSSSIRGHVMSFNCHGRSVSRENQLDKSSSVSWVNKLMKLDAEHETDYAALSSRLLLEQPADYQIKKGATHYYMGDFTIQATPNYNIAIRTLSTRTRRDELENNENLKGYFICDGSTNIAQSGGEYFNIMPLWDWLYIPGTTAPEMSEVPKTYFMQKGVSDFCGGVNDSECAVVAFDYLDTYKGINTGGRKGYFLFDDMMVCLASKLRSDKPYHTTVNQCWAVETGTTLSTNGVQSYIGASLEYDNTFDGSLDWIIHDGIGYYFPCEQDIRLKINQRTGSWYDINQGFGSKDVISGRVFQLSIEHTNKDSYQYVVYPKASVPLMSSLKEDRPLTIVNSESIQAVYDEWNEKYGVIFYEPGKVEVCGTIFSVDSPCALLAKRRENNVFEVHIADPSQKLNSLSLRVKTTDGSEDEKQVFFDQELKGKTEDMIISLTPTTSLVSIKANGDYEPDYYSLSGQKIHKSLLKPNVPYIEKGPNSQRILYHRQGKR